MGKITVGRHVKRLLEALAQIEDEDSPEPMTAEEWEAAFVVMGLQVGFRGELPPTVAEECQRVIQEVALRTGLPLHIIPPGGPQTGR